VTDNDKHSSLLRKSVNYGRNTFYDTGPEPGYSKSSGCQPDH